MIFRPQIFILLLLTTVVAFAQPAIRVGVAKTEVVGPFKPLTTEDAFSALMRELREKAPNAEFVVVDRTGVEFSDAADFGREKGFDILMWGTLRFEGDAPDARPFNERPSKSSMSAEVNVKVFAVEKSQFVLRSATWVTSDAWSNQERLSYSNQDQAFRCLSHAAEALVRAVKTRNQTGWFQRH